MNRGSTDLLEAYRDPVTEPDELVVELDTAPALAPPRAGWRARVHALLRAPAPTGLVLAAALAVPAGTWATSHLATITPAMVTVRAGVSASPAPVTALWQDQTGGQHPIDVYGDPIRVPARSVVITIAAGQPVQCSLIIDGTTVDFATATDTAPAVCTWTAPAR